MTDRYPSRRAFLRAAGVSLALPLLESTGIRGETSALADPPRRMVAMNFGLGLHGPNLFPTEAGRDYALTPYLEALGKDVRDRMTIVSGTSHPEVTLGHASDSTFLTAARFPGAPTLPEHDFARPVSGRKAQAGHAVPVADARDPKRDDFVQPLGGADPSRDEAVGGFRQDVRERVHGRRWPSRCAA